MVYVKYEVLTLNDRRVVTNDNKCDKIMFQWTSQANNFFSYSNVIKSYQTSRHPFRKNNFLPFTQTFNTCNIYNFFFQQMKVITRKSESSISFIRHDAVFFIKDRFFLIKHHEIRLATENNNQICRLQKLIVIIIIIRL